MAHHWIRVHSRPANLKVVNRCADVCGVSRAHATGLLVCLWGWLSHTSDTGCVRTVTDAELEEAAGWFGEPGRFAKFVRTHHVDALGRIKEWDTYMGPLVKAREGARRRMRGYRQAQKELQDADADRALGGSNSGSGGNGSSPHSDVDNHVDNPVTHNKTTGRNISDVMRNTTPVARTTGSVAHNPITEVVQNKELRTVGRYLSTELELVSRDGLDESAFLNARSNTKASQLQGIELVRAWSRRFYRGDPDGMLRALKRLRAVLRPAGLEFQGQTVRGTPALVVAAMNETLANPPREDDAAIVFVLKKLQSGHLHEVRTEKGEYVTEAAANAGRAEFRDLPNILRAIVPDFGSIGKSIPGRNHSPPPVVN